MLKNDVLTRAFLGLGLMYFAGAQAAPTVPEMVYIPAGQFVMGCNEQRAEPEADGCAEDQKPTHEVKVPAFGLSKTEVTLAQFREFVTATNYKTSAEQQGACFGDPSGKGEWDEIAGATWQKPGFTQTEQHPVTCISWVDAQAYIKWLNKETKANYRLPTEAEWEYAARSGNYDQPYPWGKTGDEGCTAANMADQALKKSIPDWSGALAKCDDGQVYTAPVGSYQANSYGLKDMQGNVWEWVQDCYHDSYEQAPTDGSAWEVDECTNKALRGGSWFGEPGLISPSDRFGFEQDTADFSLGFRLAKSLP